MFLPITLHHTACSSNCLANRAAKAAILLSLFSCLSATAQQHSWSVKAGANASNLHFADKSGFTRHGLFFTGMYGYHVGGIHEYSLSERFSFRSELLFNVKGANELPGYPFVLEKQRRQLHYLSLPLLVQAHVWQGISLHGGLEAGLLLNKGPERYRNNRAEAGLAIGAAKLFLNRIELSARYVHGITPSGSERFDGLRLNGDDNSFNVKSFNRVFQFSAAYRLGKPTGSTP